MRFLRVVFLLFLFGLVAQGEEQSFSMTESLSFTPEHPFYARMFVPDPLSPASKCLHLRISESAVPLESFWLGEEDFNSVKASPSAPIPVEPRMAASQCCQPGLPDHLCTFTQCDISVPTAVLATVHPLLYLVIRPAPEDDKSPAALPAGPVPVSVLMEYDQNHCRRPDRIHISTTQSETVTVTPAQPLVLHYTMLPFGTVDVVVHASSSAWTPAPKKAGSRLRPGVEPMPALLVYVMGAPALGRLMAGVPFDDIPELRGVALAGHSAAIRFSMDKIKKRADGPRPGEDLYVVGVPVTALARPDIAGSREETARYLKNLQPAQYGPLEPAGAAIPTTFSSQFYKTADRGASTPTTDLSRTALPADDVGKGWKVTLFEYLSLGFLMFNYMQ
ncbi:hypothetical protein PAPYR_8241 [Paratrimastix pyriformis]|uniref:Uncharacterized protein n=1 Tax=Paratrimastix pyriformis TaxID=342808 RepID=A0ABQ8UB27_9EUKA|nr:hypothetical protein PAPYR_8241 [Paratrimastix pyriformis]